MSEDSTCSALRSPATLQLLCQVSVLKQVHLCASKLESEYFDDYRQLSPDNRAKMQMLDVSDLECDTGEVVRRYQDRAKKEMRSAL